MVAKAVLLLGAGIASLLATPAHANRLQVGPTLVEMRAERSAEAIWLTNAGTTPLPVQLRIFRWDQQRDGESLTPSADVIVSPARVEIAPGQRQLVRLLRRTPPPASEEAFRVIVDELPDREESSPAATGLQFRLRYSIPVFLAPRAEAGRQAANLDVSVLPGSAYPGAMTLVVKNSGQRRAQLAEAELASGGGTVVVSGGLLGYVLPGRTMQWTVRALPRSGVDSLELKVRVNAEALRRSLPVRVVQHR